MKVRLFLYFLLCMSSLCAMDSAESKAEDGASQVSTPEMTDEKARWRMNGWEDTNCCGMHCVSMQRRDDIEDGEAGEPTMLLFARIPESAYSTFVFMETECENCKKLGDISIGADFFGRAALERWFTDPDNRLLHGKLRHPSSAEQNRLRLECDEQTVVVCITVQDRLQGEKSQDPGFQFFEQLYQTGATISGSEYLKERSALGATFKGDKQKFHEAHFVLLSRLVLKNSQDKLVLKAARKS